jgi:hypothetical protein
VVGDVDLEAGFGAGGGTSASEVVLAISPKKRALGSSGKVGIKHAIDLTLVESSWCGESTVELSVGFNGRGKVIEGSSYGCP